MKTLFPFCSVVGLAFVAKVCWSLTPLRISIPHPVKVGDTVTLTCDYDLEGEQLYAIKWYRNEYEFFRFVPRESPPFKFFPLSNIFVDVSGSDRKKITLKDVRKVISGTYSCEVSADAPTFHTEVQGEFMQVYELPVGNVTMSVETSKVEVGKPVKAKCQSPDAYPAPTLIWSINNETIHSDETDVQTPKDRNQSQFSESKLQVIVNQSFFDQNGYMELRCTAVLNRLWNDSVFQILKDETPVFAPILGSTSSQIEDSDQQGNFDKFMNGGRPTPQTPILLILELVIYILLVVR